MKVIIRKIKRIVIIPLVVITLLFLNIGFTKQKRSKIVVESLAALQKEINNANPGDTITLANGTYTTKEPIIIKAQGKATARIVINSESIGGAIIKGLSGFQINSPAKYLTIKGFIFLQNTGTFQMESGVENCLFTRNIFECAPAGKGNKPYLSISGDNTEISYNTFRNKDTEGCMLTIQGPGKSGMAQNTWIHHNFFDNFKPSGANNSSAIQPGLSSRSLTPAHTLIENNLFLNCRGENEGIVANKSSDNIYRYNTFGPGCREVSLRHGDRLEVYCNFFIGNSGLRFSGDDHIIYSNYFENCDFAINCTNGDGDVHHGDDLRSHDRPDGVKIVFNTLINNKTNFRMPERIHGLGATNIQFAYNIIQGGEPVSLEGTFKNPTWKKNILYKVAPGDIPNNGYSKINPDLVKNKYGIFHLNKNSPAMDQLKENICQFVILDIDGQNREAIKKDIGADEFSTDSIKNKPLTKEDVGPLAGF